VDSGQEKKKLKKKPGTFGFPPVVRTGMQRNLPSALEKLISSSALIFHESCRNIFRDSSTFSDRIFVTG
jgi:hypothetical protein